MGGKPKADGGSKEQHAHVMRQTLLFTATWPKGARNLAGDFTRKQAVHIGIGQGKSGNRLTACSAVRQKVFVTYSQGDKIGMLYDLLTQKLGKQDSAIVFAGTRGGCRVIQERLLNWFGLGGKFYRPKFWCKVLTSEVEQQQRLKILEEFRGLAKGTAEFKCGVLIATDVASRGLDITGVSFVVIYDFGGT